MGCNDVSVSVSSYWEDKQGGEEVASPAGMHTGGCTWLFLNHIGQGLSHEFQEL